MAKRSLFPAGRTDDGQDSALVAEAATGDENAFAQLFRRHGVDVINMVQRRSGSVAVADDVTAVAFERAWRALPTLHERGVAFRPWLFRVAINELIDHQRSSSRRTARELRVARGEVASAPSGDPAGGDHDVEIGGVSVDDLRAAMSTLTVAHQEILMLRYFADMEHADIATTLGIAKGTVAVRSHRAVAALRSVLSTDEGSSS